jgi:integrase
MPRYSKTKFTLGDWYLTQRSGSPAWYRATIEAGKIKRVSLLTDDYDLAKQRFSDWWAAHYKLEANDRPPSAVKLADVLNDYECQHLPKVRSAESIKIILRYWREWWGDATVADVRSLDRQEQFREWLAGKGLGHLTICRCMEFGKAAIRRAWKRGIISSVPYVEVPPYGEIKPKGRPLTVEEIGKLLRGTAEPHMQLFILLLIGTASRPEAILHLTYEQIDFEAGLIQLNPDGRKQTSKRRPVVKLPDALRCVLTGGSGRVLMFRGKPINKATTGWHKAIQRAGLDRSVRPYSIRHTCSRWMRQHGVPPWECAAQLGHSLPQYSMTERYTGHSPDYLENAVKSLNALLALVMPAACQLLASVENKQAKTGT